MRGFDVGGVDGFDRVVRALSGEPLTYTERSSPRHAIKGQVYTSTDYPPDEEIFLHNENSYQARWPLTLFFYCITAADTAGRDTAGRRPPGVPARSTRRCARSSSGGAGCWSATSTATSAPLAAGVQHRRPGRGRPAYAAANGIEVEWVGTDGLRTRAVRDAVHHRPG